MKTLEIHDAMAHGDHRDHQHGNHHLHHDEAAGSAVVLNRVALSATVHCLSGCAIGEAAGMIIGTALGWGNGPTVAVAVRLAFISGYLLTLLPLVRAGMALSVALALAFASDTLSRTTMEIVDNAVMLANPGAMTAGLSWGSLIASLILAGIAAFPVNCWLIERGQGHALVHAYHH